MTEINFRRSDYLVNHTGCGHSGLMLERGFDKGDTEKNKRNEQKKKFYDNLTDRPYSNLYEIAYQRWRDYLCQDTTSSQTWAGQIEGRLYLGLGEPSPLESAVTLHHTYGVPFIPGSAIKGILHHALLKEFATDIDQEKNTYLLDESKQKIVGTLFGREPNPKNEQDTGDAGYIIFNDAWWIPDNKEPLVKEIITVHHQKYYAGKQPATDFDSPNPNPQLAIQGSFLFSVEGEGNWADYAIKLLKVALENKGIGAKTASGYGYFIEDATNQTQLLNKKFDSALPEDKIALMVENLLLSDLPEKLGKKRNKTKNEIGKKYWQLYLDLVNDKFANNIQHWSSSGGNEIKAYKTITSEWTPQWGDE